LRSIIGHATECIIECIIECNRYQPSPTTSERDQTCFIIDSHTLNQVFVALAHLLELLDPHGLHMCVSNNSEGESLEGDVIRVSEG
jgi:hypothetical protein